MRPVSILAPGPPPPDFTQARCATVPVAMRAWWVSSDADEREAARRACCSCPVLAGCRAWALRLPYTDRGVYGGWTLSERRRLAAARRDVQRQLVGLA